MKPNVEYIVTAKSPDGTLRAGDIIYCEFDKLYMRTREMGSHCFGRHVADIINGVKMEPLAKGEKGDYNKSK
jgi:hypothetical protein